MKHFISGPNLGIITSRQTKDDWSALVTDSICGHKTCAAYDINTVFPLYLYDTETLLAARGAREAIRRTPNVSQGGVTAAQAAHGLEWQQDGSVAGKAGFGPEDLIAYVYAILYSPTYRARYAEFLKSEFARIPFTGNTRLFFLLRDIGNQLIRCHLLQGSGIEDHRFPLSGAGEVERIEFQIEAERVYINSRHYFAGVTEEIWQFMVGGYQVCHKWLKDRREMTLTDDDVMTYRRTLAAIGKTIQLMKQVDEAVDSNGGWPI
jgi:predicted helicase